jgi:hypothetical protein
MWTKSKIAVTTLALTLMVSWITASDKKQPPNLEEMSKAIAEAIRPGAGHAKLAPLAGSWTCTCRFWMDPSQSPIETTGVIERKWTLGGRFLEERTTGSGFDGKGFESISLLGFNNNTQEYVTTFACSMSTGIGSGTGKLTADGTIEFQNQCCCPLAKEPMRQRSVIRIENNDRVVTESYMVVDGKEVKVVETVATRKK